MEHSAYRSFRKTAHEREKEWAETLTWHRVEVGMPMQVYAPDWEVLESSLRLKGRKTGTRHVVFHAGAPIALWDSAGRAGPRHWWRSDANAWSYIHLISAAWATGDKAEGDTKLRYWSFAPLSLDAVEVRRQRRGRFLLRQLTAHGARDLRWLSRKQLITHLRESIVATRSAWAEAGTRASPGQ